MSTSKARMFIGRIFINLMGSLREHAGADPGFFQEGWWYGTCSQIVAI